MLNFENTKKNKLIRYTLSYISGYIYTYSLAPFSLWILAIVSPLLLLTIFNSHRNNYLAISYWYGAGYFTAGGWIWHSLMNHTPCDYIWSTIITALFTLVLALSFLPLGFAQKIMAKKTMALTSITFPLAWLLCEILRTYSSFAYPWLMIGYSQTNSPLISLLPYVGPYLFSFILIFIPSAVWGIFNTQEKHIKAVLYLLLISIGASTMTSYEAPTLGKKLTLTVIQSNIAPEDKWQANQLATIIKMYTSIIEQHNHTSSLFLLPETAIPVVPPSLQHEFNKIKNALALTNSAAILGTFDYSPASKEIYNSAITIGNATGKLYKTKLVAFGEVTPQIPGLSFIAKKLELPMPTLAAGASQQTLLKFQDHKIATFICYEIAFPAEVIARSKGAELLVVLSDNAWFGNSSASYQHRQIAQFYAKYLQKPIIFVNNSGLSSVIDSSGSIMESLALGDRDAFTYNLRY